MLSASSYIPFDFTLLSDEECFNEDDQPYSVCNAPELPELSKGKLPVVPVGDTGTIPHSLRNVCRWAYGNSTPGDGKGCPMWYVNSWTMGWS